MTNAVFPLFTVGLRGVAAASAATATKLGHMTSRKNRGFSLLEMMTVIAIGSILAGIAFITMMPMLKQNHVDQAYDTALSTIRNYRNQSITQSKRYILTFDTPGTITVYYWGKAVPTDPTPVQVASFALPSDIQFVVQTGFPNPGPDGFGTGVAALSMNNCVVLTHACLIFMPDGSAQDDAGNFNNAVIYLSRPSDVYSSRSITVWGATSRVRGWRLYNQSGNKWVQQ
jgi:prepilin-type N-terminal cleavage/methylation domain-containing protein